MPDTNLPFDPTRLKFGIGQPVPRQEDPKLLQGQGRYTDDLALPGQLYAWVFRSPYAHARVLSLDVTAAREAPGVHAVITAADLEGYGAMTCAMPLKNADGSALRTTHRPALASDRLRFVGDPIAVVVAETRAQARDAAELIMLDVDMLPSVSEASAAAAPDAPLLYDEIPGNCVLDFAFGDAAKVEAAFAGAAHVQKLSIRNSRIVVAAMEPRSAIGEYDAEGGRFILHVGCQGVFGLRNQLADDILKLPREKVRVLTGNVGGSFGMKANAYPEYLPLLHAAKQLGRPVKWTDDRSGAFQSDQHGRDHEVEAELALDAEGRFLAVRLTSYANMGAYLSTVAPLMGTGNFVKNVQSNYTMPLIEVRTKSLLTNTTPVSAYRGAGRPEGNYFMERLIEEAARAMGKDPVALRKLNHIRPDQFPYAAPSGSVYDGGEFSAILEDALRAADFAGFESRRAESKARGMLRGIGVGNFLECTAPPTKEQGGIRFEKDGTVTIITGTLDYGQGHWSAFAQVLHQKLGVPFEAIRLQQGDSDELVAGGGTGGSKSLMASGAAIVEASALVVEKGRLAAAHMLETAPADIEFEPMSDMGGRFVVAGTDRAIGLMDLAAGESQPALRGALQPGRDARLRPGAPGLSERLPCLRAGGGPRHGPRHPSELRGGQRLRRDREPAAGGGPGAWRHRPGHRPGAARARGLQRGGPAPLRQLHGLRPAPRGGPAGLHPLLARGALHHQPARRQGLRRGGLRGQPARRDERAGGCAAAGGGEPPGHAGDAGGDLAGHPYGLTGSRAAPPGAQPRKRRASSA